MIKKFVLVALLAYAAVYGSGNSIGSVKQAIIGQGQSSADYATGAAYTGA